MKTIFKALLLNLFFSYAVFPQLFIQPESAVYDPIGKRYFISNYGNGSIVEIDSHANKSVFQEGFKRFLGMVLLNDTLFVVENPSKVLGFNIGTSQKVFEVHISEAEFLNDITIDDNNTLYCTDSRACIIYKICPKSKMYSIFKKDVFSDPNGIVFDKVQNRLLVCYFRDSSRVDQIDLNDMSVKTLTNTQLSNLDGLTLDAQGNVYLSTWEKGSFSKGFPRTGKVYKFSNDFSSIEIFLTGLFGPADIFIDQVNDILVIPLFLDNDVFFHKINNTD